MGNSDEQPHVDLENDEEPDLAPTPPLVAFARRHRLVIGLGAGAVMLAFFVWSIVGLPPATVPGFFGVVQRYSFPLMCLLIAAVALTWGLKLKTLWTNIAAYAAIGTYAIYLVVGWVYEHFIAG